MVEKTLTVTVEVPYDYWLIKETLDFFKDLATYQSHSSGKYANAASAVFRQIESQFEEEIKDHYE